MRKQVNEMELLAAIFENALDAKVVISKKGRVFRANRAADRVFLGIDDVDLKGRNIYGLLRGESKKRFRELVQSLHKEHNIHQELELEVRNVKRVFDLVATADIVQDMDLFIMRDITDKVREKQSREKFIAIAGHELKTPLAVISAYTDLLKRRSKDDALTTLYLNKISTKNKLLTAYIESILDEIRIGAGRFFFEDKEYSFDKIVSETLFDLSKAYPKANIKITGKANAEVFVDRERIAQVIKNLVINAIKHSPSRKPIEVEVVRVGAHVRFSVKDHGHGVPRREQQDIFNAFYRSRKSSTTKSGMGLGLYISRRIVRQYSGTIGVESRVGKGAKFYFEIPVMEKQR